MYRHETKLRNSVALILGIALCGCFPDFEAELEAASEAMEKVTAEAEKKDRSFLVKSLEKKGKVFTGDWAGDQDKTMKRITSALEADVLKEMVKTPNSSKLFPGGMNDRSKYVVPWAFLGNQRKCDREKFKVYDPAKEYAELNQFELRRLKKKKDEFKKLLTDKIFRFHGKATFRRNTDKEEGGVVCADVTGGNVYKDLEICRSPYNFKKKRFQFELRAKDGFKMTVNPKNSAVRVKSHAWREQNSVNVGSWGGKSLKVNRTTTVASYHNASRFSFSVKVPEEKAEGMLKKMDFTVELFYKPTGLSYHKKCERSCIKLFGQVDCDYDDNGYGVSIKATMPRYEIRLNGETVASKNKLKLPKIETPKSGYVVGIAIAEPKVEGRKLSGSATVYLYEDGKIKKVENPLYEIGLGGKLKFWQSRGAWKSLELSAKGRDKSEVTAKLTTNAGVKVQTVLAKGDPKTATWKP